jgi:hypothetical protein
VTRDEIQIIYDKGPDAVIALVEGLITTFEGRIATFECIYQQQSRQFKKGGRNGNGLPNNQ